MPAIGTPTGLICTAFSIVLAGAVYYTADAAGSRTSPAAKDKTVAQVEDLFELSLEELLNVSVITASKVEERQSDAPGVMSIITRDELERFGGTTLKDILERVPGLIGSTVYMTDRSMIAIRGDQLSNSGEHVLLLINGRPIREVQEGGIKSEILETFPVHIIERIEVIKGPGSVLYGSTAFAGVINVITEKPKGNGLWITGLGGEAGAYGGMGKLHSRSQELGIIVAGRYLHKPDWSVKYSGASDGGIITRSMRIPNNGTGTYLGINYKDFAVMLGYNRWETAYFIPDFMYLVDAFGVSRWERTFLNLRYDTKFNDNWQASVNLTLTQSRFDVDSWPHISRDSSETLLEWTNFVDLSERSKLTFGGFVAGIKGIETDPTSGTVWSEGSRADMGFYAQMDYLLSKGLKVIGGTQANKIEYLDWDLVPRAGIIWYPIRNINVKALYGQAFRAASINETSLNHLALKGNPELEPEKVDTWDLSITYHTQRAELTASCFHSRLTNIIYQDRIGFPTYANRSDAITIQGLELEGKSYLTNAVFLTGSVLYQTSKDELGNEDLSPIANLGAKAGVSYSANALTLGLYEIYQGPLLDKYAAALNPSTGSYNKVSLYCKLDLNELFEWKHPAKASLTIQVDNLLDKEIWLPNWGLAPGQSIPYDQGRIIYAGLNIEF